MLKMSDTAIESFLPIFAELRTDVAFLVPTPTGYDKSIMDATSPVRELLSSAGVHNYDTQKQGPENKVFVRSFFVDCSGTVETAASLYRPVTKQGDPRIWFKDLRKYCVPCNLLALSVIKGEIFVINLSNPDVASSLIHRGYVYGLLTESYYQENLIANELRQKIQIIHDQGFLRSITAGDPGVGDTLENALGIHRNNSKLPDYKGIELKATRISREGSKKPTTRNTLFTKVPDEGMTYREIVEHYGKIQTPRNSMISRLQLYETCLVSRKNAYDLQLSLSSKGDNLNLFHIEMMQPRFVSSWRIKTLQETLLQKHHETFWVKAASETRQGIEFFRYDYIVHTKAPNASLLAPLIESDMITIDLAAHFKEDGSWRDHGVLFKMAPENLHLLFPESEEFDLIRA